MGRKLRSGYTTGACAAAAARAAATALLSRRTEALIGVIFPDRSTVEFEVHEYRRQEDSVFASVIKDAGDDPDVTNGAVIEAEVRFSTDSTSSREIIDIKGGRGVGTVTKPGLAVAVGEPAINPVPREMIVENVQQAIQERTARQDLALEVIIHVPDGEELAKKTLNERLGIIGGISILGTTGIVRPVSAEAWTATIKASLDVAEANDIEEVVLSTGRTSEKHVQNALQLREEALVMMGDYLGFSLEQMRHYSFTRVHVATMWAKLLKGAMGHAQTHVRHGVLETMQVCEFLAQQGVAQVVIERLETAHTAREIYDILTGLGADEVIDTVCRHAQKRYKELAGIPVSVHLVNSSGKLASFN